jgi:hypothetical protein
MRDYRLLEEKFMAECRAYLKERADARMTQIERYESRHVYVSTKLEDAYMAMLRAKYERNDIEDNWEIFMRDKIERQEQDQEVETDIF